MQEMKSALNTLQMMVIDRLWSKQNVRHSLSGSSMFNIALMDMNWLIYEIRKKLN